jgi:hypothetical protein
MIIIIVAAVVNFGHETISDCGMYTLIILRV